MEQSKPKAVGKVIQAEMDRYKGVIIDDMALLADTEANFEVQLAASL